ncbi:hypothetical protein GJ744_006919 [Endocarpon pusillum]|uniref:Uncharacterized protein n=1 Tax=Endocarpon pusillum TaxID=364733 RepID=A0A8H7E6P3_9EURO|nr:hypothetical protein GJ744_006919 [Endocarpon pusillum]
MKSNQMANATFGHRFLGHVPGTWTKGVPDLSLWIMHIYFLATAFSQAGRAACHSGSICTGLPEQNRYIPRNDYPPKGQGTGLPGSSQSLSHASSKHKLVSKYLHLLAIKDSFAAGVRTHLQLQDGPQKTLMVMLLNHHPFVLS